MRHMYIFLTKYVAIDNDVLCENCECKYSIIRVMRKIIIFMDNMDDVSFQWTMQ